MKLTPHTVSYISAHHRKACLFNTGLDSVTYIAYSVAELKSVNTAEETVSSNLYQAFCFIAYITDGYRSRRISVKSLIKRSNVDLYDVSLTKYLLFGRYSVNDLIIYADTRRTGKSRIAEKRRLCATLFDIISYDRIKLFSAYAFAEMLTGDEQSLARDASRIDHR